MSPDFPMSAAPMPAAIIWGGHNPGSSNIYLRRPDLPGPGLNEHPYAVDMARRTVDRCRVAGVRLVAPQVREGLKVATLIERAQIARANGAGLAIEWHVDEIPGAKRGCRVYAWGSDTLAVEIAQRIQDRMPDRLRIPGRTVWRVETPEIGYPRVRQVLSHYYEQDGQPLDRPIHAILIECGDSEDAGDVDAMLSPAVQDIMADAACAGIGYWSVSMARATTLEI